MPTINKKHNPQTNNRLHKIWLGGSLSLMEGIFGGYAMEQVKILKQNSQKNYIPITRNYINRFGLWGLLYRGYFPWGATQAFTKGLPILFVPSEVTKYLNRNDLCSNEKATLIGGISGGIAQGMIVTPTQRLKTITITNRSKEPTYKHIMDVVKRRGLQTIMRGMGPMMIRRGIDWGVRFYSFALTDSYLNRYSGDTKIWHSIVGGICAGFASVITLPIDTVIANSQNVKSKGNIFDVIKGIYKYNGIGGFYRGVAMRIVHASYHTIFVVSFGRLLFNKFYPS